MLLSPSVATTKTEIEAELAEAQKDRAYRNGYDCGYQERPDMRLEFRGTPDWRRGWADGQKARHQEHAVSHQEQEDGRRAVADPLSTNEFRFRNSNEHNRDMLEYQAERAFLQGEFAHAASFSTAAGLYAIAALLAGRFSEEP